MTHAEQILRAVAVLIGKDGNAIFSRDDIRVQAKISREDWEAYSATFQGMRSDEPGGARNVGTRYKNVFKQVSHGKHTLTDYGRQLIAEV
jgi:hypothetical protein